LIKSSPIETKLGMDLLQDKVKLIAMNQLRKPKDQHRSKMSLSKMGFSPFSSNIDFWLFVGKLLKPVDEYVPRGS